MVCDALCGLVAEQLQEFQLASAGFVRELVCGGYFCVVAWDGLVWFCVVGCDRM